MFLIWVAVAAVGSAAAAYLSVLGFMYVQQRAILYLPRRLASPPDEAGLPGADVLAIETADGERIIGWYLPPGPGQPLLLHFHGNACCLVDLAPRLAKLTAGGWGVLAVDYRGFGGSGGTPTEAGLHLDADAAYAAAIARGAAPHGIVVVGESLGSAVAVALAARRPVAGLILEAPFTSAVAVAAHRYPLLPVRLLMRDRFRSDLVIGGVSAPILIVHGTADGTVPHRHGQALHALAPGLKSFVAVEGGGHQVLDTPEALEKVRAWVAALPRDAAEGQPPTREAPVRAI